MDIFKKTKMLNKVKDYSIVTIALLISAACFNVFLLPLNIVSGGTGGVATITKYAFNIDQSLMILILSIICLIFCRIYLGKEVTATTAYASLAYPVLVKATEFLTNRIDFSTDDMFIIIIFSGIISGITTGIIYKIGYNSGGFSAISQILYEKCHISVAKTSFIINIIIVGFASYYFGLTKAIYAIIFLYINNIVMDKVILGISNNKAFYIVTSKPDQISNYIIETLGHDTTYFEVKGGFLEKRKNVLLTVIPSNEYYKVKEGIKLIDDKAFFIATDSYEVKGAQ